ncbi:MAG: DUF1365 domain-containing protein [Gammaproteobacteria bacterium]|nr:DUF1365 domain-containing protein [Gammaproteobacteria bacterium]
MRDAPRDVTAMRFWSDGEGEGVVAALTDQGVPIDITLPRDAAGRLIGRYWALVLLVVALIAMFHAAKLWRRRKRQTADIRTTQ